MQYDNGLTKVGSTGNIKQRYSSKCDIIATFPCENRDAAYELEFAIHEMFVSKRIGDYPSERFNLTIADVSNLVRFAKSYQWKAKQSSATVLPEV